MTARSLLGLSTLGLLACVGRVAGEEAAPDRPAASLTGGVGNSLGWWGLQGEGYFARGRLSAFAGIGYAWGTHDEELDAPPIGVAFAIGGRAFTPGPRHRGFVELSVSLIGDELKIFPDRLERVKRYGPGLQVGYQLIKPGGFTFLVSAGAGYAPGVVAGGKTHALFGIAVGRTWRRRPGQPTAADYSTSGH